MTTQCIKKIITFASARVENEACYDDKDVHDNSSSCQQTFLIKLDDVPTGENQEMCRYHY